MKTNDRWIKIKWKRMAWRTLKAPEHRRWRWVERWADLARKKKRVVLRDPQGRDWLFRHSGGMFIKPFDETT